ncbi:MAG: EAL domain [Idiomarinaceae bacterium HL-53]|nr:MAG: EAL domain [Idiomarinaceae bacterium HL-53]CUS47368.1 diguanylate cyclase (GGDEF) domain-containing protein [Idiomarinaceae bacterium HL-53]
MISWLRTHPSPAGATYYTMLMTGIVIGVFGLLLSQWFSSQEPIMGVLSVTASVVALATGLGLYAVMRGNAFVRVLIGGAMAALACYSIYRSVLLDGAIIDPAFSGLKTSAHWPLAFSFLVLGLLIMTGLKTALRQQIWQVGGAGLIIWGVILNAFTWFQSTYVWIAPHPMVASISSLFVVMTGIAVWFGGEHGTKLQRLPTRSGLVVGFLGVFFPTVIWFALAINEAQNLVSEGNTLAEEVAERREDTSWRNINLMVRLAARWSAVSDDQLETIQEIDILRYLNDEPQIKSIILLDDHWNLLFEHSLDRVAYSHFITERGFDGFQDVQSWLKDEPLARSVTIPLYSITERVNPVVLFRQPIFRHERLYGFVVAVYDFAALVNPSAMELDSIFRTNARIGPYLLSSRGSYTDIQLASESSNVALYRTERVMELPYMPPTNLSVYLKDTSDLRQASNIQTFVLIGGFLLAVFLVISMENGKILRRQRSLLKRQATRDELTQLPNRAVLEKYLSEKTLEYRQSGVAIATLFIDLDGFKPINDSLGLAIGDELLFETARRLQLVCASEHLVARFGGDEFVIVMAGNISERSIQNLVRRLLSTIAQPFVIDENRLYLTASIGITTTEQTPPDPRLLIQHADMAMYQAKRQGRNHFQYFSKEMIEKFHESVSLRNKLQQAMDKQELQLYYQPILACGSRKVIGVEALLRWEVAPGEFVSPADFIPLAEDSGQIIPISVWVVQQACRDGLDLLQMGDYTMSVNLSAVQFQRANFVQSLEYALEYTQFPANKLRLELTESVLVDDQNEAIRILNDLRKREISVSIDDFGTGFSSLSYLRNLPANQLKIDRSFVADIGSEHSDGAITRGIIAMASELNMQVVAEGVETEAQVTFVEQAGAHAMQGYYFARSMPIHELRMYIQSQQLKE